MRRVVDDERMMLKVCDLYYNQNLGQREIAATMDLSRPTVSRLLTNARERGIVRIILADLTGRNYFDIEQQLEKKFGLKEAILTESYDDRELLQNELGRMAAQYLERILKNGDSVGVSMGTTLTHIIPHISADYLRDLTFIPLIGGIGESSSELYSNYLAETMAKAFGGISLALHAPAMVSRIQAKNELLQEESISRVLARTNDLQVALSGIGAPDESSTIITAGFFSREMIEDLHRHNICGDICMRYFDEYGNLSLYEHNQRVIGINIETLRLVPRSIGVAGGVKKANAIKGALAGRYINVLITDIDCAKVLLS